MDLPVFAKRGGIAPIGVFNELWCTPAIAATCGMCFKIKIKKGWESARCKRDGFFAHPECPGTAPGDHSYAAHPKMEWAFNYAIYYDDPDGIPYIIGMNVEYVDQSTILWELEWEVADGERREGALCGTAVATDCPSWSTPAGARCETSLLTRPLLSCILCGFVPFPYIAAHVLRDPAFRWYDNRAVPNDPVTKRRLPYGISLGTIFSGSRFYGGWPISYQAIACPTGGGTLQYNLVYWPTYNQNLYNKKLQITGFAKPLSGVEIRSKSDRQWKEMKRSQDGYWELYYTLLDIDEKWEVRIYCASGQRPSVEHIWTPTQLYCRYQDPDCTPHFGSVAC